MFRKETSPALAFFALFFLVPAVAVCSDSAELMPPIRIEDALRGISIEKHARFVVGDIEVDSTSVMNLFAVSDSNETSDEDYLSWRKETISIKLKEDRLLSQLKYLILSSDEPSLTVLLVDPHEGGLVRWLRENVYFFLGPGFSRQKTYPVVVKIPPCDRVTQVIFHGIDSLLQREITKAGQIEGSVGLDQLFLLLRKDRLDSFMDKFGPIDPSCPAFRLLQWIRNEEVHGFDFEDYSVKPELGSVLDAIARSIARFQDWQRYKFKISVVGYTDQVAVKDRSKSKFLLIPASTGVKSLRSRSHLKIFYRRCLGDSLTNETPEYLNFFSSDGTMVQSPIESNCALGAVRAYTATAFLIEKLGRKNIEYEYATGGISPVGDNDALKRKVDLKMVVKAASQPAPAQREPR